MQIQGNLFEGTDFLLDMETTIISTPNKRRRAQLLPLSRVSNVDIDYVSFLDDLHDFWDNKFVQEDDDDNDNDNDHDPTYLAFLQNLKVYGNAYMCDVSLQHGVLSPIIYEVDTISNLPVEIKRRTPRARTGTCIPGNRNLYKAVVTKNKRTSVERDHSDGIQCRGDRRVRGKRSFDVAGDHRSGSESFRLAQKLSANIDKGYGEFMNNLHVEEHSVFYEFGDRQRVYYEVGEHQMIDVEIEPPKRDSRLQMSTLRPTPTPKPPTPPSREQITTLKRLTSVDDGDMRSAREKEVDKFWRKLHKYLRQPYDQEEYDELWKELNTRTPVSIYRESRSGGSYRPGHLGKSYLDRFQDLQLEIEKVRSEPRKVLNLLRMCKFYLEKIPCGAPKPWKDDSSMTILPAPR